MADRAHSTSRRALLAGLSVTPIVSCVPALAAPHPDADLIAMGRALSDLWVSENEAVARFGLDSPEVDRAEQRIDPLIAKIEKATATTLEGVMVKARACSYCHSGEPFTDETFGCGDSANLRIAGTLMRDLLAMGVSA